MATKELAEHYSRNAEIYGYDVRACEYKGKSSFDLRQKSLIEITGGLRGKTILDIGCGSGILASPLAKENRIIGVDISPAMLKLASVTHRPVTAIGQALPFSNETFDVVLGLEVLPHVPAPADFIAEVTRVVKGEGCIILSMIHSRSWLQGILRALRFSPRNYHLHSPDEIAGLMASQGWKISELQFLAMPFDFSWPSAEPHHPFDCLSAAWMAGFRKKGTGPL